MTMLSFRVAESEAQEAQRWAEELGVRRSQLIREALRQHLLRLASQRDADTWERRPLTAEDGSLSETAQWGPKTGLTGQMRRGDVWFVATPGGDRPVLVLTRDPVADRIGAVVVAALTRTTRGLVSELELTPEGDGVPTSCVTTIEDNWRLGYLGRR